MIFHRFIPNLLTICLLTLGGCAKDDTVSGGGGPAGRKSYNKTMDGYLAERYLWNDEYRLSDRDLTRNYAGDDDNFVTATLMKLRTNTLDRKRHTDGTGATYYSLYSGVTRKSKNAAKSVSVRGVDNGMQKERKYGFGFGTMFLVSLGNPGSVGFVVAEVYPGSPAAKAGFRRGTIIRRIDGQAIQNTPDVYNRLYRELRFPTGVVTVGLELAGNGDPTIPITSEKLYLTPVLHSEVIADGANRIGYLVYNGFDAAYDDELLEVIGNFKAKGISDLILDLRYNGGGHLISSRMLASCIAGTKGVNRVFAYYRYNADRMASPETTCRQTGRRYDPGKQLFYEDFTYGDYYGVDLMQYDLGLERCYVLVSDLTASASETLIYALRGIGIPVILLGSKTEGKNVGMEVKKFNDGNYAYTFSPITFQTYNAARQTVPATGIPVDYAVDDWDGGLRDFGVSDPMTARALSLITDGSYTVPATVRAADGFLRRGPSLQPDSGPSGQLDCPPQE